jgi:hypothetical protein
MTRDEKVMAFDELLELLGATTHAMARDRIATFRVQLADFSVKLDKANEMLKELENIRHYGVRKLNDWPGAEGPAYETTGYDLGAKT